MDLELRHEVYKKALEKWGRKSQLEMAQEEATELALAVRKYIRKDDDDTYVEMISEIADVEIMIEQIKLMYKKSEIIKSIEVEKSFKVHRLKERLEKNQFED
jgi:NTP pyrophosphatase (non-canonical NTP hydrolase)